MTQSPDVLLIDATLDNILLGFALGVCLVIIAKLLIILIQNNCTE